MGKKSALTIWAEVKASAEEARTRAAVVKALREAAEIVVRPKDRAALEAHADAIENGADF